MWKEIFEENKLIILIGAGLTAIVIIIALVVNSNRSDYKIEAHEEPNVAIEEFDDEFFNTIPQETIIEKPQEKLEIIEPESQIEEEDLDVKDVFEEEVKKEKISKALLSRIRLAKIHQTSATQVWENDKRFERAYQDQPIIKLRKKRREKDIVKGSFGDIEEFCEIGDGDCLKSSKPTNLEHTIMAGTAIPIVLTQNIVSDIPTAICRAEVTQNVTGFHGDNILIPRNSVANCKVVPLKSPTQKRIQIVFTDIFTPNGVRIKGNMAGTDKVGAEGVQGEIDSRMLERIGFPLLTAAVPVTVAYTLPASTTEDEDRRNSAVEGIVQALNPIVRAELDRTMDTMPRITIKAGEKMEIHPTENLIFKKYKGGKFMPTWQ